MKYLLLTISIITNVATANSIKERVELISSLIDENPDKAIRLAIHLREDAKAIGDGYGIVNKK